MELSSSAPRVLLVDDEPNVLRALGRALSKTGWVIDTANSGTEALEKLAAAPAQVVVSDFRMTGITGVELLRQVKERWPDTQRVMLTGQADQETIKSAINRSEIFRFLSKPWDDADLLATLHSAVEAANLARENRRLHQLTLEKNEELAQLNATLEARVLERTALLTRSKREWEAAFDALDIPVTIVDRHFQVRRANLAWSRNEVISQALVRPCFAHFGRQSPCPGCPLSEVFDGAGPHQAVERELTFGDRRIVVRVFPWPDDDPGVEAAEKIRAPSGEGRWAVVTYRDVTEERKQADWKLRTEHLAAVGRLAGGVAHEINNPLAGVLAFTQIMRGEPRNADDEESLRLIEESALRCKRIVESLLRFAGVPGENARRPIDLRRVTQDTLTLFNSQMKSYPLAKLEVAPEPSNVPTLLADPHAVGQALMEVLHHRLRALPASGGTLTLSLAVEGDRAGWVIVDTAPRLGPEEVERLADPTVSDVSGLGLTFRIVGEHEGRLDVTPLAPQGNRFALMLGGVEKAD